jgi:type VI secretion system protein ImpB
MANEGSVAPKERVNIVYRPATGGMQAEIELPLKLMVLGDFTLRDDSTPVEDRKPINIDKDNFNDVLKGQNLSLDLTVPNKLSNPGDEASDLAVKINFESLNDFSPDAIVEKIPELANLINLRDALKALKGPLGNIPEFRKRLQDLVQDDGTRARLLSELGIQDDK